MDIAIFVRAPEEVRTVLHAVDDLETAVFFSTSPSARMAVEAAGFEVETLQEYVSEDELDGMRKAALGELEDLWKEVRLQGEASGDTVLGEAAIRKMVWYLGSYELLNFRKTAAVLEKLRTKYSPQRVVAVSAVKSQLMNVRCDPLAIGLRETFENVTVLDSGNQTGAGSTSEAKAALAGLARTGVLLWRSACSALGGGMGRVLAVSSGRLFGSVLGKWQLLELPIARPKAIGEVTDLHIAAGKDWCQCLMIAELTQIWDFLQGLARRNLWWLDRLIQRCHVVVFGYPPISAGLASICVERARHLGVPVVGYQHGPNYGMQWVGPKLYLSDYSRCDVVWSWGLSRERMQAVLPAGMECPPVMPLGRLQRRKAEVKLVAVGEGEAERSSSKWDIVFPVTLVGEWSREPLRIDAEVLLRRQVEICELLDRLAKSRGLRVLVKPIRGLPEINDPISLYEKRWPNLIWNRSILFGDVAVADKCRMVLTEFPSSPLFEALAGSVPVVAMNTPFVTYTDDIIREMGQAVRWADDIDAVERELVALLDNAELAKQAADDGKRFAESVLRPADAAAVDQEFARLRGVEKLS
jgi:hypothetical protein